MNTYKATYGQTLLDIAIQLYGSAEAVVQLAVENKLSITATLVAGQELVWSGVPLVPSVVNGLRGHVVNTGDAPSPAPSALTATPDGIGRIILEWIDNSGGVVRFRVFRDDELVADLDPGTEFYTDTELDDSTLYTYKVAASSAGLSFSGEASATTVAYDLELVFLANHADFTFTSSSSQTLHYRLLGGDYELFNHALNGVLNISQAGGATVRFYFANRAIITAIAVDDAAQLRGALALGNAYTALRTVTAKEGSFAFTFGNWVQHASVAVDLANSIITAERVPELIDSLILANGGTATDDGENYTGTPGATYASRTLTIGTIELDLTEPDNQVLYQKIVALQSVGWTISTVTTVCTKSFDVDTSWLVAASVQIERTREMVGIEYVAGTPMNIDLYDTFVNAEAGGATGRLAQGYPLVDLWLRNNANYNAWVPGTMKAMRFYAADNTGTGNQSIVRYKAAPTGERACGAVTGVFGSFLGGNAKVYDGSSDYDVIVGWLQLDRSDAFSVAISFKQALSAETSQMFFEQGDGNTDRNISVSMSANTIRVVISNTASNRVIVQFPIMGIDYRSIVVVYDGSSLAVGISCFIDGAIATRTVVQNNLTLSVLGGGTMTIGARDTGATRSYLNGLMKSLEIINRVATLTEIESASVTGSFRGASIAHNSGEYLLAVDFDKTDGNAPTTFPDTPVYTITSFGGATYTPYL